MIGVEASFLSRLIRDSRAVEVHVYVRWRTFADRCIAKVKITDIAKESRSQNRKAGSSIAALIVGNFCRKRARFSFDSEIRGEVYPSAITAERCERCERCYCPVNRRLQESFCVSRARYRLNYYGGTHAPRAQIGHRAGGRAVFLA